MKKSQFTESQIEKAFKEHETGKNVDDICRPLGINRKTLNN
jgi:putative transposase